eukprot:8738761-Heterocapsa_arctica.AAC.1
MNNAKIAEKQEKNGIDNNKHKERQAELHILSEIILTEKQENISFGTANAHLENKQADPEQ